MSFTKNLKPTAALLALALLAASAAYAPARSARARAQQQAGGAAAAERPAALTPEERRGKVIYTRGESPSGREIVAAVGEIEVPASTVTCAGCHGSRGEGKTEGGVTAGAMTWAHLTSPHTHPSGRRHTPFDYDSFVRSVVRGVDPSGNELMAAMPRFRMAPEDMSDLVAYLKRVGSESEPGVTAGAVRTGTVLPTRGPLAEMGGAMRDVLAAYFEDVNGRGGIYGRRVELRVAEMGDDARATAASVRRLLEQEEVFAVVGGTSAGADRELAALARETGTPLVGPATLLPQTASPAAREVFYVLPGLGEQARALVNFAAGRPELKQLRMAVVYPEGEVAAAAAAAAEDQARKVAPNAVTARHPYRRAEFDARQLVQKLKAENAGAVFFLGAGGEEASFVRAAAEAGWTPHVLLLGALLGRDFAAAVPASFKDRVFVAFPTVPTDITPAGVSELRALQEKYKFAPRHTASQLAAFAAAKIFVEGLRRAGQDLTRERLITALEGLYDYDTGVTPRLSFGPNRRVGAAGANVLTVDPEKKEFAPAGGWVKAY